MIKAHEEYAREAAATAPRSCASRSCSTGRTSARCRTPQYYDYAESIPGPDHRALPGPRRRARDGAGAADVRAGAGRRPLQHRRRRRRRRRLPGQVPQAPHPAGEGLLGEVLLPARQPGLPGVRHRRRQGRRLHLLRPPLPRGVAGARSERRRDRVQPVGHQPRACRPTCGSSSSRRRPSPTSTTSAPSTGSASSRSATTTSTARRTSSTPRASSSARSATTTSAELVVRDLDMDLLAEVRNRWAFYRDRRPETLRRPDRGHDPYAHHQRHRRQRHGRQRRRRAHRRRDHRRPLHARRPPAASPPTARSTPPASTSSRAASTCTPTWSCRSAARSPPTPSRPARWRRRGAARPRSSTSPCSARARSCRTAWRRGTPRPTATAPSTTAST